MLKLNVTFCLHSHISNLFNISLVIHKYLYASIFFFIFFMLFVCARILSSPLSQTIYVKFYSLHLYQQSVSFSIMIVNTSNDSSPHAVCFKYAKLINDLYCLRVQQFRSANSPRNCENLHSRHRQI